VKIPDKILTENRLPVYILNDALRTYLFRADWKIPFTRIFPVSEAAAGAPRRGRRRES